MDVLRPIQVASTLIRQSARSQHIPRTSRCASRFLHSTTPKPANPFPTPAAPGPPPPAPQPAISTPEDRLARKRKQAALLQRGREMRSNPAQPSTVLHKRFWKDVLVKETPEGLQVYLDARPVRTANRNVLNIPKHKHQLATAIALEWDLLVNAQQALKYHYIPLTSLTARAIDIEEADAAGNTRVRDMIVTMMMKYLHTDTLLCWAPGTDSYGPTRTEGGESLRQTQIRTATPIISHLTTRVWPGIEINPVLEENSIMPTPQPEMTQAVIKGWMYGLKPWDLAGLERAVLASKSLLTSVRFLVEWSVEHASLRDGNTAEKFGIEEAACACNIEVDWQTSMWGEVEDTHDVEKEDVRRQLGGVVLLISGETS